jgi:hypothetical protein
MSTKTTFKRIALVAVAALGLGVLSVAPSSATVSNLAVTVTDGTSAQGVSDSTTAAIVAVSGLLDNEQDTITVQVVAKGDRPTTTGSYVNPTFRVGFLETTTSSTSVVQDGVATVDAGFTTYGGWNNADSMTATTYSLYHNGASVTGYAGAKFWIQLDSVTAVQPGTYAYTVIVKTYDKASALTIGTVTKDINIVVATPAADSKVANAALSTAVISAGTTDAGSTQDSVVAALATASTTAKAVIKVTLKNAAGGNAQESLTAVITGPGQIGVSGGSYGKNVTIAASAGVNTFEIRSDGTAGTASIAISSTSVTFAAKSVTFYAAAAKTITAATNKPVIAVSSNSAVVYAKAVDANGAAWGGAAYIYAASAADALIAGSETPVACTYVASDDVHACPVTGKLAGTANFKVIDAATVALATATSNSVAVKVSTGTPASVKLAFDKATYAPGEKAQVWVTALDSAGNALPEQTITALFATGGITSSTAFSSGSETLTATDAALAGATSATAGTVAGYKVYTVYMPMSSGEVKISATGGTGLATAGRVAVSATASVVNTSVDAATDAANEATDAANAATDAALAAADAADAATAAAQDASDAVAALSATVAKLVASLKAQITSLTNLVIKIQKKVRA